MLMQRFSITRVVLLTILALTLSRAPLAHADTFGSDANLFSIDFVTIGNPGNADDTTGDPTPPAKSIMSTEWARTKSPKT